MHRTPLLYLLAVFLFSACDDDATSPDSTDTASDTNTSGANVFTHVPPTDCAFGVIEDWVCAPDRVKTQDWACPEGWTPTAVFGQDSEHFDDFSICSPPATPPGIACPAADPWHDEPTIRSRAQSFSGRIWYAKPDAPAGGDGSRDLPFSTIAAALAAASDNDIIALSTGTFDEAVTITRPIALVGACVAQTKVAPSPAPERFKLILIEKVSGGVLLSDLTASGEAHPISEASISGVFIVTPTKPLTAPHVLQSIHIDQAHRTGLLLSQTHATLRDVWITNTQPDFERQDGGYGLNMSTDAQATIDRAVFSNNRTQGVIVGLESSALTLHDAVIKDTQPSLAFKDLGTGLAVAEQGRATLERVLLSQNHYAGISADLGSIALTDVAILDTQPQTADSDYGMGLLITSSQATATRLHIARNHLFGAVVSQLSAPSSATFDTLHIADTKPAPCNNGVCAKGEPGGGGLGVGFGARADISNFEITGSAFVGLQIYDSPTDPNPNDGPTTVTARDGLITRNLIGLNNQTTTLDLSTDFQNVLLFGNNVDQDFSELAIPKLNPDLIP